MKVVQIVPTPDSAITIQAKGISKHNTDLEIKLGIFHPKRPDKSQLANLKQLLSWADVIDAQYWKSASKVRECFPDLWKQKKKLLTHYNPYNLLEEKWEDYDEIIVVNSQQAAILPNAKVIPLSIDLDFFKFNPSYTNKDVVHMSVARIEGKKGVFEVATACKQLNYKFVLVGRVSDMDYVNRVKAAGGKMIDFRQNVPDRDLKNSYFEAALHLCNSIDNFETGTLPVLEAMASGVPVLSRKVGHVPDLYDGENIALMDCQEGDQERITAYIKELMEDRPRRLRMREKAAETVKSRDHRPRAAAYRKIYEALA